MTKAKTPRLHISAAKDTGSKVMTSGAQYSPVSNRTLAVTPGAKRCANPKSINFTSLLPFVRHTTFSGYKR